MRKLDKFIIATVILWLFIGLIGGAYQQQKKDAEIDRLKATCEEKR